jgi:hypothetical protein
VSLILVFSKLKICVSASLEKILRKMTLTNKNIILAVSGSIAAYKAPDIVRRLQDLGAEVRVVLTQNGAQFVHLLKKY